LRAKSTTTTRGGEAQGDNRLQVVVRRAIVRKDELIVVATERRAHRAGVPMEFADIRPNSNVS
jgi:hypothetical protein